MLIFFAGDRYTRNLGPQLGREEHDRDAGDHSTGSPEGGRTVLHRHVRAVWLHSSTTGWLYAAKKTAQRIFKFYLFISSLSCSRASDLCSRANLWWWSPTSVTSNASMSWATKTRQVPFFLSGQVLLDNLFCFLVQELFESAKKDGVSVFEMSTLTEEGIMDVKMHVRTEHI